jgi:small ligand-binding sensory domain FIST
MSCDVLLHITSYLNVYDGNQWARVSRRSWFVMHHFRRLRGPELVASASHSVHVRTRQMLAPQVMQTALQQLQGCPNVALAFHTPNSSSSGYEHVPRCVPKDCVILGAISGHIQSSIQGELECKSKASIMLGSFPQACMHPFSLDDQELQVASVEGTTSLFERILPQQEDTEWKLVILYASGYAASHVESVIAQLQQRYPHATIVGGISDGGYISTVIPDDMEVTISKSSNAAICKLLRSMGDTVVSSGNREALTKASLLKRFHELMQDRKYYLRVFDDDNHGGIFGVGISGDIPVQAVVSRGVQSLTTQGHPQPFTPYYIVDSQQFHPGDQGYLFQGRDLPSYHLIRRIQNRDTGKISTPREIVRVFGQPNFVGLRPQDQDGFELYTPHPLSYNMEHMIVLDMDSVESLTGYNVDLYDLDSRSCLKDVETTMERLKEQTENEQILGAVMFSCNGRGPYPSSFICDEMGDAKRFAQVFPQVPLLGFYANGEIGPSVLAGRQSVFQVGQSYLQGFTVVLALLIVPKTAPPSVAIDDSDEAIAAFMKSKIK